MPWLLRRLYKGAYRGEIGKHGGGSSPSDANGSNGSNSNNSSLRSPSPLSTDPATFLPPRLSAVKLLDDADYDYDRSSTTSASLARPRASESHLPPNTSYKRDVLALRNEIGPKLVVVMVGLPARGKSYICKKLSKYLSWCGFRTKVFNVGNRRRVLAVPVHADTLQLVLDPPMIAVSNARSPDAKSPDSLNRKESFGPTLTINTDIAPLTSEASPVALRPTAGTSHDASFFDSKNEEAKHIREQLAMETLEELISWLKYGGGKVAVHDATNTTVERRRAVLERVKKEKNMDVIFVESICTDQKVLEANIRMKLKGPDYINMPEEEAIADFVARMKNYEKVYEPISEEEEAQGMSFIKLIDVGRKVIAHNMYGFLPSQCVFYLMQIHIKKRVIWLTRHGESTHNQVNRVGGDAPLTETGTKYATALAKFIKNQHPPTKEPTVNASSMSSLFGSEPVTRRNRSEELHIWTSTLERSMRTAAEFDSTEYDIKHIRFLNEISAGMCENMTYEEIEKEFPEAWEERKKNKLMFRYPGSGGESYLDVIERLRPLIIELERMESNVLIVTHRVVMRTLLAYFCASPLEDMPTMQVPLHCVYKLTPLPYGADVVKYQWREETDEFEIVP